MWLALNCGTYRALDRCKLPLAVKQEPKARYPTPCVEPGIQEHEYMCCALSHFVLLVCHYPVLDGSINIFKLSTLEEVPSINLGNIKNEFLQKILSEKFLGMPRITPCAMMSPHAMSLECTRHGLGL